MNIFLLAQVSYGNEKAQQIVSDSLALNQYTQEAWQRQWDITVNTGEPLWQSLCDLGGFLAAIALLFLLLKDAKKWVYSPLEMIEVFSIPVVLAISLMGNGYFLVNFVFFARELELSIASNILNSTFAGISISNAIGKIQNTTVANTRAREIFAECVDKTGAALTECVLDPVKVERAKELLDRMSGDTSPLQGNVLEQAKDGILSGVRDFLTIDFINIAHILLNILQFCFVNIIEISLLLTALYIPISIGLSFFQPTNFLKWLSGFFSLLILPIGYVIIVSFMANIIAQMEKTDLPIGSAYMDTAFLVIMSIFAPLIALYVSKGIGDGIFEGITKSLKMSGEAGMAAASSGSSLAAKTVAANMAAKTLEKSV